MATEVEERIVAAKFDSSDFEKGVDKTVKKLDELKESLDFKKTGESLEKLGKKTTEATENASKSLEKLSERFTNFTGMLKQKLLSGLADQVVNVFFRMEHAITGFVRSISSSQIMNGMSRYENMLTAVRMITNATYDEIDAKTGKKTGKKINYSEEAAYSAMEKLQSYADETSYSLDQMSDAMSKMVASGVGLDDAAKNVMGIANACAFAGVNAQDASRAFFNLSQAYSSGALKYTDYRSLELLNMTNEGFKEQLLLAGEAAGVLKKVKEGVWKTQRSKNNKKVTAGKTITMQNLSESLRYNWADKTVMDQLFGKNFYADIDEITDLLYNKGMSMKKVLEIIEEKYGKVAAKAFAAGREARNFTDVMNTWRDMVATSWSKTWEKLFGQLEDATSFFTDLADGGIADFIRSIFGWRNEVLDFWNEGYNGGEAFREMILSLDEALGNFLGIFSDLLPSVEDFADMLFDFTVDANVAIQELSLYMAEFRSWWGTAANEGDMNRMQKLQMIIGNISSAFGIVSKVVDIAIRTIGKLFYIIGQDNGVFDSFEDALLAITKPIKDLNENSKVFDDITNSIDNLLVPIAKVFEYLSPFVKILGDIAGFFFQMSIDTVTMNIEFFSDAIGLFLELFTGTSAQKMKDNEGVIGKIVQDVNDLKEACKSAYNAVKEFFDTLIKDLRTVLGLPAEEGQAAGEANQKGGLFSGLKNFFETNEFIQQAQAWVEQAKKDIIKWFSDLPQTISNFINNLLYEPLTKKVDSGSNAAGQVDMIVGYVETPLKQWLDTAVDTVAKFIADIPTKLLEGIGTIGNFVSMVINAIFGSKDGAEAKKDADTKKQEDQTTNAIKEWADKFSERFQKEIKLLPMRIRMYIRIYSRKMKATWKNFKTWFNNDETIATIKEWGASIYNSVKDFILKLPEHIMNLIKTVGATGRSIIGTIKELFKSDDVSKETQKELENGFNGISIQGVLDAIANIGKEIANQFLSWFTGSEDMETNFNWLKEEVSKLIWSIPEGLRTAAGWAVTQLGTIWDNLYKALMGKKDKDGHDLADAKSGVKYYVDQITDDKGNLTAGITDVVNIVSAAIDDAITVISNLWGKLLSAISGSKKPLTKEMQQTLKQLEFNDPKRANELKKEWANFGFDIPGIKSGFEEFVGELGKAIVDVFSKIPGWITEGLNVAVTGINTALEWLTNNLSANIGKTEEEVAENVDKDNPAASGLETSFTKLGTNISNLIFKTIPGAIATGFDWVKEKADKEWIPSVIGLFASINENKEFIDAVGNIGDNIVQWIKDLPEKIRNAFEDIKIKIKSMISGKPEDIVKILENPAVPNAVKNGINWIWDNAGKKTAEGAENSTLWGTITSTVGEIGTALSEAFNALFPDIESWFAELPVKIINGLNAALTFVNDQVGGIAKWFEKLNAVDEKEASEQIEGAITNATKEAGKGAENAVEKEGDSQFKTAMLGLGATIRKAITETIPAAILSGFEYVRSHWKEWTAGLFNFFADDEHKIKADDINISSLVDALKTKLQELPGKITEEIDKLKRTFFKKELPKNFIDAYNAAGSDLVGKKNMLKTWDSQGYNISQITGEKTILDKFADFGGSLGKSIADGIKWAIENLPQMIIDGWNNSVQILNGLIGAITDWFGGGDLDADNNQLGDKIQDRFEETQSPEIQKSLTGIGQSLVTLFKDTIPRFLGSGIGQLINWVPDMITAFMEGLNGALNQGIKEQTPNLVNDVSDTTKEAIDKATSVNLEEELVRKIMNDREYRDWLLLDKFQQTRINQDRFKAGLELYVDTDLKEKSKIVKDLLENDLLYNNVKTYLGKNARDKQFMESAWDKDSVEVFKQVQDIMKNAEKLSYGEAAVKNAKAGIEGAGDVLNLLFTTAFNVDADGKVTGLSTESWIVIGAVLVTKLCELIEHIKEIPRFSSTERVMANNSIEHVLSLALIITGIGMGFATIASQLNDKQFNNAMTAFDKVSELIGTIVTWYGVIKGSGTVLDFIGTMVGGGDKMSITGVNLGAFGTLAGISALVDSLTSDFALIGGVINTFAGSLKETADILVTGGSNINSAVSVMDDAIKLLNKVREIAGYLNDSLIAGSVINNISSPLGLFMKNTSGTDFHATEMVDAIDQLINMKDRMDTFSKWSTSDDTFKNFKYALTSLGSAMSLFSNKNYSIDGEIDDNIIEGAVKLLKSIVGDNEFTSLAEKIDFSKFGTDPLEMQEACESMIVLANALGELGPAAASMKDVKVDDLNGFFEIVSGLKLSVGQGENITEFAANMLSLGTGLGSLAIGASGLTDTNVALASRALTMLTNLAKETEGFQVSWLEAVGKGGGDLGSFGVAIENLGGGMSKFFNAIEPYTGTDKILQNEKALTSIMGLLNQFSLMAFATQGSNIATITAMISGKGENSFARLITGFTETIGETEITEEGLNKVRIITSSLKELFIGLGQITNLIPYENKIGDLANKLFTETKTNWMGKEVGVKKGILASMIAFINDLNTTFGDIPENGVDPAIRQFERFNVLSSILSNLFNGLGAIFVSGNKIEDYSIISKSLDETFNYLNTNFDLIKELFDKVENISLDKLEKAKLLFAGIYELGLALSQYSINENYGYQSNAQAGLFALGGFDFDLVKQVLEKFINAYNEVLNSERTIEDVKASGKTMASYLFDGMQEAFNTDTSLQLHITPVFDYPTNMSDGMSLDNSNINFGSSVGQAANLAFSANEQTSPLDYSIVLSEMNGKLSELDSKLNSINSNTGAIIPAFAGARLIVDTNALAVQMGPEIDRWLATAGYLYLRHNSQ